MSKKELIIKYLKKKKTASGNELCDLLGISRQALNKHIQELISKSIIAKNGTTKNTLYEYASDKIEKRSLTYKKTLRLENLEEDMVFQSLDSALRLNKNVNKNTVGIIRYAFTEMLNNAIEHSQSDQCVVSVLLDDHQLHFKIRDYGIGLFYSIYSKLGFTDENAAVGELFKGRTTTMKERHSGEGIFFTSRCGDNLQLRSHNIHLTFDAKNEDIFVEEKKFIRGTEVQLTISKNSKRKLEDIFRVFAPEEFDYRFEKTRVFIKLYNAAYVSRSEAKRLLQGLEKFKEIVLDFKGVRSIGQGFCDEIFRIFKRDHPDIRIRLENINDVLQPMIDHVATISEKEK
jgi:anti-sigma regulatory factor (Ser/Thr protein kinase)